VAPLALIDGFVHPALAAGVLLASVPLLIHLLNRQRHRPMPWAAMRFVQAAWKRTRRRSRLEDLLLLLLRMAAVALLALAVARPFAGRSSPLAGLTDSRRDLVLALDGSASTGWRGSAQSVFEQILERARAHLNDLDGGRGDRVRLFLCGAHPRLLSWRTPEEALELLSTLSEPTDEALDLPATLAALRELASEDARANGRSALELRLLTDLQRHSFDPPPQTAEGSATGPSAIEELDKLRELGGRVLVEDLGPAEAQPENVAVTDVELSDERVALDVPSEVLVRVQNFGSQTKGAKVWLEVDGEKRPIRTLDVPAAARRAPPSTSRSPRAATTPSWPTSTPTGWRSTTRARSSCACRRRCACCWSTVSPRSRSRRTRPATSRSRWRRPPTTGPGAWPRPSRSRSSSRRASARASSTSPSSTRSCSPTSRGSRRPRKRAWSSASPRAARS
jgi:hypothetical protein